MKKILSLMLAVLMLLSFSACIGVRPRTLSGNVTLAEWLACSGEGDDFNVTVTITELLNPYYARVEDDTGSVLLFGLWGYGGDPKAFIEEGISVGDTIVLHNPRYNVYEGNVEMKDATLVEILNP